MRVSVLPSKRRRATAGEGRATSSRASRRWLPSTTFAKALDDLEVQQRQQNLADIFTWEEVEYALVYTKMDRLWSSRMCRRGPDKTSRRKRRW
jgi:hypothetical protein